MYILRVFPEFDITVFCEFSEYLQQTQYDGVRTPKNRFWLLDNNRWTGEPSQCPIMTSVSIIKRIIIWYLISYNCRRHIFFTLIDFVAALFFYYNRITAIVVSGVIITTTAAAKNKRA